jgi:hypothetical protein
MEELLKIKLMIDAKDEKIKMLEEALSVAEKALKAADKVVHIHNHYDQACSKMHYPFYTNPGVVWANGVGSTNGTTVTTTACNPLK